MLLCIDIGNTNITLGLYVGQQPGIFEKVVEYLQERGVYYQVKQNDIQEA